MIEIKVTGLDKATQRLDRLQRRASGMQAWQTVMGNATEVLRRYAAAISPVDTGAYQSSHRTAVEGTTARVFVDPHTRNPRSGQLVTRYAAAVEERDKVYAQTADLARGLVGRIKDELVREITR